MTPGIALHVSHLSRVFTNGAGIHDICLSAQDRSVTAVIGPNGAGKTVLFSAITGLCPADEGDVEVSTGRTVAYCPDVPQFESWLTATEIVETSLALSDASGDIGVSEALDQCGLTRVAKRRVADFSRGMLQRLGIAAALVLDPGLLILDEPNSALDPVGRADVRRLIQEQKRYRCILLSSHLLSEVEQLADHVVVISEGRVISQGTTADLLTSGREPSWTLRLLHPCEPGEQARLTTRLSQAFPSGSFTTPTTTTCTVRFPSLEMGTALLPQVMEQVDVPMLEVTLTGRDLDASFAHLVTGQEF